MSCLLIVQCDADIVHLNTLHMVLDCLQPSSGVTGMHMLLLTRPLHKASIMHFSLSPGQCILLQLRQRC